MSDKRPVTVTESVHDALVHVCFIMHNSNQNGMNDVREQWENAPDPVAALTTLLTGYTDAPSVEDIITALNLTVDE